MGRKSIERSRVEIPLRKLEVPGLFHAKMATIKDRNGMDLKEAKDIKRSWKNTWKNYTKKILMTEITTMV